MSFIRDWSSSGDNGHDGVDPASPYAANRAFWLFKEFHGYLHFWIVPIAERWFLSKQKKGISRLPVFQKIWGLCLIRVYLCKSDKSDFRGPPAISTVWFCCAWDYSQAKTSQRDSIRPSASASGFTPVPSRNELKDVLFVILDACLLILGLIHTFFQPGFEQMSKYVLRLKWKKDN